MKKVVNAVGWMALALSSTLLGLYMVIAVASSTF